MADTLLSGKALFVLAIMMVATYTFTGIIYPESEDSEYSQILTQFNLSPDTIPLMMDFPMWIQIQYIMAHDKIMYDTDVSDNPYYDHETVRYVEWNYKEDNEIFERYGTSYNSGLSWYNSDWVQTGGLFEFIFGFGISRAKAIENYYNYYVDKVTKVLEENEQIDEGKKTLLGIIWDFIGSLVNGFINLMKLLTFTNIPNTPLWLVGILNIVFIPLWFVLVVGIAPYVAKLIEAGAKFLDALIPF